MRVAVVGATGLIGRRLVEDLCARGDEVVAVSRRPTSVGGAVAVAWDPSSEDLPPRARDGVDAIVNLAGEPLTAGRWTAAARDRILASRVVTTRAVAAALRDGGPGVLVNASAVGYYGPTDEVVDEQSRPGADFLASVCVAWERAAHAADDVARVVTARSGVVLASDGGALPRLARLARLGVLGAVGSGRQWVPWLHVRDEAAALVHCLDRADVRGPVNLVAPHAVRQRDVAAALRGALHRPSAPPAPALLVRAAMGAASDLVLTGQRAVPSVLEATGFCFEFPELEPALADLLGP